MNEVFIKTPVLAGDVSGIASALFELGGMVVIHDPSGCNSTYNTHDELRWYDTESLIFLSGLTIRDAIRGNDGKLIDDIIKTAAMYAGRIRFIALCNSPIPFLNGTDFRSIAEKVEKATGLPAFYVPSNGMKDYAAGIGQAYLAFAKKLLPERPSSALQRALTDGEMSPCALRINILGMTPLDYPAESSADSLREVVRAHGAVIHSLWSMGDETDHLLRAGEADVSLVIASGGLLAARFLKERYGVPYVVGSPVPGFADCLFEEMRLAASGKPYREVAYTDRPDPDRAAGTNEKRVYIGDCVLASSLALAAELSEGTETTVLVPFDCDHTLIRRNGRDQITIGEADIKNTLTEVSAEEIDADPLYRPILPEGARLLERPSLSVSGRLYRKHFKDVWRI